VLAVIGCIMMPTLTCL